MIDRLAQSDEYTRSASLVMAKIARSKEFTLAAEQHMGE
jgi:hypothetical protein